jgi:hypothetical protein
MLAENISQRIIGRFSRSSHDTFKSLVAGSQRGQQDAGIAAYRQHRFSRQAPAAGPRLHDEDCSHRKWRVG